MNSSHERLNHSGFPASLLTQIITGAESAMLRNRASLSRSAASASRLRSSARTVASSTGGSTG